MPNPRFLSQAQKWRNEELPSEKPKPKPTPKQPVSFPDMTGESTILGYDMFGEELIRKSNERFTGTRAEIPLGTDEAEVPNIYILKRLALTTTIYQDNELRSVGAWPITPLQSETLLQQGNLPKPEDYWEDLALVLYDRSPEGTHPAEAEALYQSLLRNHDELEFSKSDLENRLLIVNAGAEPDSSMPYGVKPIVLPGITQVYAHDTLKQSSGDFKYGLDNGLPAASELGSGDRFLSLPDQADNIGLRVLYRGWDLSLGARDRGLVYGGADGRVNLCAEGTNAKS